MSDERQARIEAISAVIDRWFGGVGDDYTQAANDILVAADAVGRERVSEKEADRQLAYIDEFANALARVDTRSIGWFDKRRELVAALGDDWVILPKSALTAAPAERGDLDTMTAEVGAWGERTFPNATSASIIAHLEEEFFELADAPTLECGDDDVDASCRNPMAEEAADCLMLLMQLAHRNGFSLLDEARKKFAVNQTRTWHAVPGGYSKHDEVKP